MIRICILIMLLFIPIYLSAEDGKVIYENRYIIEDTLIKVNDDLQFNISTDSLSVNDNIITLSLKKIKLQKNYLKENFISQICLHNTNNENIYIPMNNTTIICINTNMWEQGFGFTIGKIEGDIVFPFYTSISGLYNIFSSNYFHKVESFSYICKDVEFQDYDIQNLKSLSKGNYWIQFAYRNIVMDTTLTNIWFGEVFSDTIWLNLEE